MTIKIVVESLNVNERNGNNERGPWSIREQEMWAHLVDREGKAQPHPSRITIKLDKDQPAYAVGEYTLAPQSFYSGKFASLMFVPRLLPIKQQPASVQRAA